MPSCISNARQRNLDCSICTDPIRLIPLYLPRHKLPLHMRASPILVHLKLAGLLALPLSSWFAGLTGQPSSTEVKASSRKPCILKIRRVPSKICDACFCECKITAQRFELEYASTPEEKHAVKRQIRMQDDRMIARYRSWLRSHVSIRVFVSELIQHFRASFDSGDIAGPSSLPTSRRDSKPTSLRYM